MIINNGFNYHLLPPALDVVEDGLEPRVDGLEGGVGVVVQTVDLLVHDVVGVVQLEL